MMQVSGKANTYNSKDYGNVSNRVLPNDRVVQ
jgi:hypothetical protein